MIDVQVPEVDVVLVGCGGGGLVAGVAAAIKEFGGREEGKEVKVYAVEPETANCMFLSLKVGMPHGTVCTTKGGGGGGPISCPIPWWLLVGYMVQCEPQKRGGQTLVPSLGGCQGTWYSVNHKKGGPRVWPLPW